MSTVSISELCAQINAEHAAGVMAALEEAKRQRSGGRIVSALCDYAQAVGALEEQLGERKHA